jgi:23S rRNA (guanosine2251-2'-O)-methyltransferase
MALAGFGIRVEGLNAVRAAALAGRVIDLWVETSRLRSMGDLAELVTKRGGRFHRVDSLRDNAETEHHQGVVADCRPLPIATLEELVKTGRPALMVLDHIVDPHNLGAIARSSKAAGMTGLVASTRRAAPLSATAFKAAAGAFETLPVAMVSSIADALSRLNQLGVWTVGLDVGGSHELFGLELLSEPVAMVVGAEGTGLSELVRNRLELTARIDLAPEVESLNVSVAAALAAFEIKRLRDSKT